MSKRIISTVIFVFLVVGVFFVLQVNKNKGTNDDTSLKNTNAFVSEQVQSYINSNYPGYTIARVQDDPMCTGELAVDVFITHDQDALSLIFTPEGNFVQSEVDVDYSEAPAEIDTKLHTDFSEYTPSEQIEKLTLANGDTQYLVDITKDSQSSEVIFDSLANVVCTN